MTPFVAWHDELGKKALPREALIALYAGAAAVGGMSN